MLSLGAGLAALVAVLVLTPLWIRIAPRVGAVDHPRGRHQHERPMPTGGGVAIILGTWGVAAVALGGQVDERIFGMLLGSLLLACVTIYDDIRGLSPLVRLAVQFLIAVIAYLWGVRIEGLGSFWGLVPEGTWIALGWLSAPLTVLWIVFITNGLNWLDGLDGLVGGVAGIAALTVAIIASTSMGFAAHPEVGVIAAAIAGSCAGFLRYNYAPAKVFMGDTGAMFLGFNLACLSVLGAYKGPTAMTVIVPLLVLAVPILDSSRTIAKRLLAGKSPFEGDRSHIHYRLVDRGLTKTQAVLVIYGMCAILCLCALRLWWG